MKKINLFFLRKNAFECIVTTQDSIAETFHKKVTLEIEPAKKWAKGISMSGVGTGSIPEQYLELFNDEHYIYLKTTGWADDYFSQPGYVVLPKAVADGGVYRTENIIFNGIHQASSTKFLFVE